MISFRDRLIQLRPLDRSQFDVELSLVAHGSGHRSAVWKGDAIGNDGSPTNPTGVPAEHNSTIPHSLSGETLP